jgi:predicted DNA-binding protein with PD1-like motif
VNEVKHAFSESCTKKDQVREFRGQLEVTTLLGNVRLKNGEPFVHVHATFRRNNMSVVGGHVVSATVSPMFELMTTPTKGRGIPPLH